MNTQFLGGVLVARMLEGMRFALGPCIVARRSTLDALGGIDRVQSYLAEDFVLGKFAHEAGAGVILSSYVVEHHIGNVGFTSNLAHRLRWVRSTRRSRPWGYVGELFTNPLPIALALCALRPDWWIVAALAAAFRAASAGATAGFVLRDRLTLRYWWALPVQDLLAFFIWLLGFYGNHITWRGRVYYLHSDGRFEPLR
jgi:ceramide glucosyltransferase